jgi:hypothetical protein
MQNNRKLMTKAIALFVLHFAQAGRKPLLKERCDGE